MMVTRRNILKFAAMAQPLLQNTLAASHNEFWNSKDPSQWTDKETTQILTHSPWAKQASVESPMMQGRNGGMGAPGGGMGRSGGGMGGGGMGRSGGGMGGGGGVGTGGLGQDGGMDQGRGMPDVHALVRWESALPVSAAEKKSPPAEAAQSYIISVTGLPPRRNNSTDDASDRVDRMGGAIKQNTSLERKGKDPIAPDHVEFAEDIDGDAWRFSFPRNGNPITAEDKDVTFMTRIGRVSLKTRFSLKEMMYKDQLAL